MPASDAAGLGGALKESFEQLAVPVLVESAAGYIGAGGAADTYLFGTSGSITRQGADFTNGVEGMFYLDAADFTVSGRTPKLRLRAQLFTNATSVGAVVVTPGLYPLSASAGGVGAINLATGAVVAGLSLPFTNPATSSRLESESADAAFPAAGYYVLAVAETAGIAANSLILCSIQLLVKYV